MKNYIYILLFILFGCQTDNIGPLLKDLDIFFFLEDSIDVREDRAERIVIEVGSTKGGNSTQITLGGTAKKDVDYKVANDLNLAFEKGEYIVRIVVTLIDNIYPNDNKTITLSLPKGQGYSPNNRREYTINIIDDDAPSGTVLSAISTTDDDVEEGETGPMDMNSSDLEFGEFDTSGTPDRGIQIIGLRFNKITVPAKAKITSASIQFTCDNTGSKPVEMTIYCQNIGNAPKFVDEANNVTKRTKSEEKVVWSIPPWLTKQEKGADQKTPDLKALVQAIINRTDWRPDNSIVFIMENTGVSANVKSNKGGREAETFDGTDGGVDAPVLKIDWEK